MEAGDPRVIYHAWQGSRGIVSCTAHRRRAAVSTGLPGRISNPKNSCFCDRLSIVTVEVVLLNNYTLPNSECSFLKCTPQNTIYANAQFITFEMNSLSLVILTSNRFNNMLSRFAFFWPIDQKIGPHEMSASWKSFVQKMNKNTSLKSHMNECYEWSNFIFSFLSSVTTDRFNLWPIED